MEGEDWISNLESWRQKRREAAQPIISRINVLREKPEEILENPIESTAELLPPSRPRISESAVPLLKPLHELSPEITQKYQLRSADDKMKVLDVLPSQQSFENPAQKMSRHLDAYSSKRSSPASLRIRMISLPECLNCKHFGLTIISTDENNGPPFYIDNIVPGSVADKAQLKISDEIYSIDNVCCSYKSDRLPTIFTLSKVNQILDRLQTSNRAVEVRVVRIGEKRSLVDVTKEPSIQVFPNSQIPVLLGEAVQSHSEMKLNKQVEGSRYTVGSPTPNLATQHTLFSSQIDENIAKSRPCDPNECPQFSNEPKVLFTEVSKDLEAGDEAPIVEQVQKLSPTINVRSFELGESRSSSRLFSQSVKPLRMEPEPSESISINQSPPEPSSLSLPPPPSITPSPIHIGSDSTTGISPPQCDMFPEISPSMNILLSAPNSRLRDFDQSNSASLSQSPSSIGSIRGNISMDRKKLHSACEISESLPNCEITDMVDIDPSPIKLSEISSGLAVDQNITLPNKPVSKSPSIHVSDVRKIISESCKNMDKCCLENTFDTTMDQRTMTSLSRNSQIRKMHQLSVSTRHNLSSILHSSTTDRVNSCDRGSPAFSQKGLADATCSSPKPPRLNVIGTWYNCAGCNQQLGASDLMIVEQLNLFYHLSCFVCSRCGVQLSDGKNETAVRIRRGFIYCYLCYHQIGNLNEDVKQLLKRKTKSTLLSKGNSHLSPDADTRYPVPRRSRVFFGHF